MKDEDKSYLWMIQHHIEALVTLLDMNKQHEILNNNVAYDFMHYMASQSETIWEEGVWEMVAEILLEEPKEKGENVIQFSPELRGPDR
tara:strand:+ start:447 stop:710 length:264 start_codon:yes stop_codon:yes gene_type:complete